MQTTPPLPTPSTIGTFGASALAIGLIAAADLLFYGQPVGISLSAFLVLLALATLPANRLRANARDWMVAGTILVLAMAPAVESIGLLSVSFAFAGLAAFALIATGNADAPWPRLARRMAVLLTGDPFGLLRRFSEWRSRPAGDRPRVFGALAGWLVPLALGGVFVALFSMANPVFWSWVSLLDLFALFEVLEPLRILFWLFVAVFVSAFVRVPNFAPATQPAGVSEATGGWSLSTGLVTRSLVVFNAIFALQTLLDAVYLWGGAELPEGVTPAANAQKAAYILVVSALLAAAFVLGALRNGDDRGQGRLVLGLIHVWIAQNVVLVFSAILRLALYVEIYSLTLLRLSAFIWMGLVAIGLILIVARIALAKSNGWLVRANLVALGVALYACSVVDLNAVTANYNVTHSREVSGQGVSLDRAYLCGLGPSALPAIDRFRRAVPMMGGLAVDGRLAICAIHHRAELRGRATNWRAWTFRDHRLRLYLAAQARALEGTDDAIEDTGRR